MRTQKQIEANYTELIHAGEGIEINKGEISATGGSGGLSLAEVRIDDFDSSIGGYPIVDYDGFISDLDNFKDSDMHVLAVMNRNYDVTGYLTITYDAEDDRFFSPTINELTIFYTTSATTPYIRIALGCGLDRDDDDKYFIYTEGEYNITLSTPD